MKTETLRRLLGEATPGPWEADEGSVALGDTGDSDHYARVIAGGMDVLTIFARWDDDRHVPDVQLITAAVNALPLLLDVVDAAREFSAADLAAFDATDAGRSRRETKPLYEEVLRTAHRFRTALAALEEA